jgi:hypothetical protein
VTLSAFVRTLGPALFLSGFLLLVVADMVLLVCRQSGMSVFHVLRDMNRLFHPGRYARPRLANMVRVVAIIGLVLVVLGVVVTMSLA